MRLFNEIIPNSGADLNDFAPDNDLTDTTSDWVLAEPGSSYLVFLREGGNVSLDATGGGTYDVVWFNPRTGETTAADAISGDPGQDLGAPPSETAQDWVVWVHR